MADDPAWLEELWPLVDTNKNGFLDSEDDLALFDLNENGRVEPKEMMLFDKIQTMVARELNKRFDENADGSLDGEDIVGLEKHESENFNSRRFNFYAVNWNHYDSDRNGKLNKLELERRLQERTLHSILSTQSDRVDVRLVMMRSQGRPLLEHEKIEVEMSLSSALQELWRQKKTNQNPTN